GSHRERGGAANRAGSTVALRRTAELVAEHACLGSSAPRSAAELDRRITDAAPRLHERSREIAALVDRMLESLEELRGVLSSAAPADWADALESIRAHLDSLRLDRITERSVVDFATAVESIEADRARVRRLPHGGAARDREASLRLAPWVHRAAAALGSSPPGSPRHASASALARETERLRIALHGGRPGHPAPASVIERELERLWATLA
ncbi:MAG: DUF3418 domain-containing protein, partial [Phycisphaerae bacterium]|nr:DUF3418 domain-containing protein [Phycisphaerae bacterium]